MPAHLTIGAFVDLILSSIDDVRLVDVDLEEAPTPLGFVKVQALLRDGPSPQFAPLDVFEPQERLTVAVARGLCNQLGISLAELGLTEDQIRGVEPRAVH